MNIEEVKNNYLLSIGCSIKDGYTYIIDNNYTFNNEEINKNIQINDLSIRLNNKILNTSFLDEQLSVSTNNFFRHVNSLVKDKIQDLNKQKIVDICAQSLSAEITYYSDYIKFLVKNFPVNEELMNLIISLTNNAISSLNNNMDKLLQRYDVSIHEINMKAASEEASRNQKTIAEVNNASSYVYGYDYLGGRYNEILAMSSMRDSELQASLSSNKFMADMYRNMDLDHEHEKVIQEIDTYINNSLYDFNTKLKEIIIIKLPEYFEDIDITTDSLEKCPYNINLWFNYIKNIKEEDYSKIKEIFDFYKIDFSEIIENNLINNIYDYYISNNYSLEYNENDLKLYLYLKGLDTINNNKELNKKIYDHFISEIKKESKEKKYNFEEIRNVISITEYLDDSDKEKINNYIDETIEKIEKDNKNFQKNKTIKRNKLVLKLFLGIILIALFILFVWPYISNYLEDIFTYIIVILCTIGLIKWIRGLFF